MPRRLLTKAELKTLSSYFRFLATVPYLGVEDPAFQADCPLCKEPFQWLQPSGKPLNRPVRLSCGHVFGLQCLAQWMFSPDFDGHCCFCRAIIVDPTRTLSQHTTLNAAVTNLKILGLFQDHISAEKKTELLSMFQSLLESRRGMVFLDPQRLLALWEEVLESLCDELADQEPVQGNDVPAPPIRRRTGLLVDFFCRWGIVFAIESAILWDRFRGGTREDLLDTLCTIRNALCLDLLVNAVLYGRPLRLSSLLAAMKVRVAHYFVGLINFFVLRVLAWFVIFIFEILQR